MARARALVSDTGEPRRRVARVLVSDASEARRRVARVVLLGGLIAACAGFVALGVWQVERRAWKLALIEQVQSRTRAAPVAPPTTAEWTRDGADAHAYRRVAVTGRFLPLRPVRVQATTTLGAGFWLLAPLRTRDGATVLVNRGFVAPGWTPAAAPAGEVRIVGLVRESEPGGGFLRANAPAEDRWHSRDVAAIAASRGLADAVPYFIDAERGSPGSNPDAPGPVGGLTVLRFHNNHLQYAVTWFVLAAMAAGAAVLVAREARVRRAPGSPPTA